MRKFTIFSEPQIDCDIQQDLDLIVTSIEKNVDFIAIYLIGGFGRGEGSVFLKDGRWRGVNDFDLMVIVDDDVNLQTDFKTLGAELASAIEIDYVDLGRMQLKMLPDLSPTIQNYDFKYGSQLLAGKDVLNKVPEFKPNTIPIYEFIRLLCNRAAGILTTQLPKYLNMPRYNENQIIKACIAVGDTAVYLGDGYHHSYQVRYKKFIKLAFSNSLPFDLPDAAIQAINISYKKKIEGPFDNMFSIDRGLIQLMISKAYCALAEHCASNEISNLEDAEKIFLVKYSISLNILRCAKNIFQLFNNKKRMEVSYAKNVILFSQPVFYNLINQGKLQIGYEYMKRFWHVQGAMKKKWSVVSAVELWEKYNH